MLDALSNGPVFRAHTIDVYLKPHETMHVSLFSDLHIDSSLCDHGALVKIAEERRKLPNHGALAIGDVCDLVVPTDVRRYRPSARPAVLDGRDDYVSAAIEMVIKQMRELKLDWHLISPGNHEDTCLKYHGIDSCSLIAHALGAKRGSYWGILDYRIRVGNKNKRGEFATKRFRIVYAHGNWAGALAKGYSGAIKFASAIEGWDIFAFGHNHASRVDPELRLDIDQESREVREREVYIVNCSSFTSGYSKDPRFPSYKEVKGYPPTGPKKAPLIRVTPYWQRSVDATKKTRCGSRLLLDVSIEV